MDLHHCRMCGAQMQPGDYYASNTWRCKLCYRKRVTENRHAKAEQYRAYDKVRSKEPERVEMNTAITREYRAANPARYAANNAVNNAIRDGKLKRQPCWVCGEKAVAHHPDYSAPLDVVWLCQPHHKAAHAAVVWGE